MKVGIVNDLSLAQEVLKQVVTNTPTLDIAWIAADGQEAIDKAAVNTPDIILMDLIMPHVNGVQATEAIMKKSPCAIIIVTASVEGNGSFVYEALGHGAVDVVKTPFFNDDGSISGDSHLIEKINRVGTIINKPLSGPTSHSGPTGENVQNIIAIGSSTGGPQALATILKQFPPNINASILIVQHVDSDFAQGLASWLNDAIDLPVEIAQEGQPIKASTVHIASTQDHLVLQKGAKLHYTPKPIDVVYRPSVDVLFRSLAENAHTKGTAILLTGMGQDGADGLLKLKNSGWHTIAQDEATSIVYGMPKAAAECGAAKQILPLPDIASHTLKQLK